MLNNPKVNSNNTDNIKNKTDSISSIHHSNKVNININIKKINSIKQNNQVTYNKLNWFMDKWKTYSKNRLLNNLCNKYIIFHNYKEIKLIAYRYKKALQINKFVNKKYSNNLNSCNSGSFSILTYLYNSFKIVNNISNISNIDTSNNDTSNIVTSNNDTSNIVTFDNDNKDEFILINIEDLFN